MKEKHCAYPPCKVTFYGHGKYCSKRHYDAARRSRERIGTEDNESATGIFISRVLWVNVIECPKDDESDDIPMFTPKFSRFPLQQFTAGLREGVWPEGMRVRLNLIGYSSDDDGKKHKHAAYRIYTIPKPGVRQVVLSERIEADSRRFTMGLQK